MPSCSKLKKLLPPNLCLSSIYLHSACNQFQVTVTLHRVEDALETCLRCAITRVLTLVCTNERIEVKGSILKLMPQDSKALA